MTDDATFSETPLLDGSEVNGWTISHFEQPKDQYNQEKGELKNSRETFSHYDIELVKLALKKYNTNGDTKAKRQIKDWDGESTVIHIDEGPQWIGGMNSKLVIEPIRMKVRYRFKRLSYGHRQDMIKSANKS